LRARGAGELCAFTYTDGVAVAGALRRDALDALGRSRSPLVLRGSPLALGVRTRAEGDPDAPAASADADELADDGPERGARMLMLHAAGADAGERARMLNADGAAETARPAADALLPARGRVIAVSNDVLLLVRALRRRHRRGCAAHGGGARGEGRVSRPHAPSRRPG
jgi:hypothetical protein